MNRKVFVRRLVPAVLLVLGLIGGARLLGGSLAWLQSDADRTNTFGKGSVTTEVVESFDGSVKRDVKVKNTGNVPAFIRVALAPAWKSGTDIAARPVQPSDYTVTLNTTDWFRAGDYYYHKARVPAGGLTNPLINRFELVNPPSDLTFELQVICSGIQQDPAAAVQSAWPDVRTTADGQSIEPN